jgi:hypothetical protein
MREKGPRNAWCFKGTGALMVHLRYWGWDLSGLSETVGHPGVLRMSKGSCSA